MAFSRDALPIFEETCAAWVRRLAHDESDEARALHLEAQNLMSALQFWRMNEAAPDVRTANIGKVLALHRRALEYSTRKP